jgi:uncharacterized delta-60 repeat protein
MRLRTSLALLPLVLLLAFGAVAAPPTFAAGHLDRGFGHAGVAAVAVPKGDDDIKGFEVAPDGRSYVLDGKLLLAFQADGEVDTEFGEAGRVEVATAGGGGETAGLALDPQGRLLVAGSVGPGGESGYSAFVIRYLPDGTRDPSFGEGGEVDTDFGLPPDAEQPGPPSVTVSSILVDPEGRPVLGGSFGKADEFCGYGGGPEPFVARLTEAGAIDTAFGGKGFARLRGPGVLSYLDPLPQGGTAAFATPCSSGARVEWQAPRFSALSASGEVSPSAKELPLGFTYEAPATDPSGRVVEVVGLPPAAEGCESSLLRLLPDGHPDPSFGTRGTVKMRKCGAGDLTIDPQGRPLVVQGVSLKRYRVDGRLDRGFGPGGVLRAKGTAPTAIAFDSRGRVYTVGVPRSSKPRTLKVARFTPGH